MNSATNRLTGRSYSSVGSPCCWIRPSRMTTMTSLIVSASSWSWVTYTNVIPTSRWSGLELELHLLAQLEVEGAQRLVEEQHGGLVDERPGEGDPLLLAARQLPGPALAVAGEPDERERLGDAALLVAP